MSDIDIQRIVRALRKIFPQDTRDNLIYGEVKKTEPLEIEIGNGVIITSEFLFLGQMCRPHKVKIPHTHEYNGKTEDAKAVSASVIEAALPHKGANITTTGQAATTVTEGYGHQHDIKDQVTEDVHKEGSDYEDYVTIEIEPKLQEGDTVLMFAFNNFQRFYVAERIEKE